MGRGPRTLRVLLVRGGRRVRRSLLHIVKRLSSVEAPSGSSGRGLRRSWGSHHVRNRTRPEPKLATSENRGSETPHRSYTRAGRKPPTRGRNPTTRGEAEGIVQQSIDT